MAGPRPRRHRLREKLNLGLVGTIAAAAFGAILYTVVTGGLDRGCADQYHQSGAQHQRVAGDDGAVTVEAAFAVAALVVVLALCVAGLTAVSMQVRCVDPAREAAPVAARGDDRSASDAAHAVAPDGAAPQLRRDGELVVATVTACSRPT